MQTRLAKAQLGVQAQFEFATALAASLPGEPAQDSIVAMPNSILLGPTVLTRMGSPSFQLGSLFVKTEGRPTLRVVHSEEWSSPSFQLGSLGALVWSW